MNATGKRRLLKLAAFLRKLPREKFDFTIVAREAGKPMREALKAGATRCGTTACAVGWMPAVFPRSCEWIADTFRGYAMRGVVLKGQPLLPFEMLKVAEQFFGLTDDEVALLFVPSDAPTPGQLGDDATPKQVARHIERFVKRQERA